MLSASVLSFMVSAANFLFSLLHSEVKTWYYGIIQHDKVGMSHS